MASTNNHHNLTVTPTYYVICEHFNVHDIPASDVYALFSHILYIGHVCGTYCGLFLEMVRSADRTHCADLIPRPEGLRESDNHSGAGVLCHLHWNYHPTNDESGSSVIEQCTSMLLTRDIPIQYLRRLMSTPRCSSKPLARKWIHSQPKMLNSLAAAPRDRAVLGDRVSALELRLLTNTQTQPISRPDELRT